MPEFVSMSQRLEFGGMRAPGKMKYLVEKKCEENWVPMARFHEDSDPEKREALCAALGGEIRVLDVEQGIELSNGVYV